MVISPIINNILSRKMTKLLYFLGLTLLLIGCSDENIKINPINGVWDKNNTQKFEIKINNYQTPKKLIFVVRNNNEYPYANLRVFATIKDAKKKNKKNKMDTLNYILAEPNGMWLGKGFGETKEILFQYKKGYKFPKNGIYTIEIQHAMRDSQLKGIEDFGIKIE